jgi:hypothetical protein
MSIENQCVSFIRDEKYAQEPGYAVVLRIRNLLADTVIKMCPHPVTESVACEPCTHAAFVVRSA